MSGSSRPTYLLDTNVLVHLIRGNDLGRKIDADFDLRSSLARTLICVVTVGELRALALRLGWGARKSAELDRLLSSLIVVDIHRPDVIAAYAEVDVAGHRAGRSPGKNDVWIAAVARASGATLLTTDKDFDHLDPGLIRRVWINPAA